MSHITDALREMLVVRDLLESIADKLSDYVEDGELPEIVDMQRLERQAFQKINKWDEPT